MTTRVVIENPILNGPFGEPTRHFRFDDDGITDEIVDGRRRSEYFMPIPAAKKKGGAQAELVFDEWTRDRIEENKFINEVREAIDRWRLGGWQHTTGVTRRLLEYWTEAGRERPLFFCQVEALETAIFLSEAAGKVQRGTYFGNELRRFNDDANPGLQRIAHKMATGTGKTVVMAMLIAWQTLNKAANPHDGRFSDAFLIACPGITIRDRLRVVLPSDPNNYYRERDLVPPELRGDLGRAKVVITNFHAFKRREMLKAPKTTKQILGDKADAAGLFTETPDQMVRRVMRELGSKKNIVVINDEAHHCYRRRPDAQEDALSGLKGAEKKEASQRDEEARVWISGLEAIARKVGIRSIYDLSATPFFLRGSGYSEGTLFPWVVSDFSLIDAIEAGLVKIPRVPVDDDAHQPDQLPTYRNLWLRIRDDLPKKGRKADAVDVEPNLPAPLEGALHSLYSNYAKSFERWQQSDAEQQATSTPPVFIVVANNTTVSKMIYDWIAGWSKAQADGIEVPVPGQLDLFSNVVNDLWAPRSRSILVDSSQLETGDSMSAQFKKVAAQEIEEFKAEYMARFPGRDAAKLTDEDLLREVMNTVGKPGKLGEHVRCVVSVSMLTEGWDANTVTHVLGVRAFGTQLLCEQVVGRGLRRMSYAIDDDSGHFTPEYAEIYGIPFSFIPASGSKPDAKPPAPTTRVRALEDRIDCEITFPIVVGYRWDIPEENLAADFDTDSQLALSATHVPTTTEVRGSVGEAEFHSLDDLMAIRPQAIAFDLAKRLLDRYFRDAPDEDGVAVERPWLFPKLLRIAQEWMADPAMLVLKDNAFPQLLAFAELANDAVDRIYFGIVRFDGGDKRLRPMLRAWDPVGSTRHVDFDTARPVWPTDANKCHISHVAADTDSWEQRMAQALEELPEVVRYAKNQSLGFTIPYSIDGEQHAYIPDFIADIDDGHGPDDLLHVVIEVTGRKDKAKVAKVTTTRELWVPAVNSRGAFGRWSFVEVTDPWDAHVTIRGVIDPTTAPPMAGKA